MAPVDAIGGLRIIGRVATTGVGKIMKGILVCVGRRVILTEPSKIVPARGVAFGRDDAGGRRPSKRFSTEQIITKLRQAAVELSRGLRPPQVCKKLGISEQTYYRWRKEYGGLRLDQAKRLKTLAQENARLKRIVADQALDNAIVKEVASGKF